MVRAVRGLSTSMHRVGFLAMLVSWFSIGGGLLPPTCAKAATSEWRAAAADTVPPTTPPTSGSSTTSPTAPPTSPPTSPGSTTTFGGSPAITVPHAGSPAIKGPKGPNYSLHLHGGLFAPIDVNATSPTMGMRLARNVTGHLQAGLMTGWTFRRKNLEQPVPSLPGIKPQLVLARLDGHLVPLMGFLQVNLSDKRYLIPYGGIALGYEWLSLVANDYVNGGQAHSSYANWAWESWGGIGIRLDQKVRFDTELFYNGGSLERDVVDSNGLTLREAIDANGVGARVGVGIQF